MFLQEPLFWFSVFLVLLFFEIIAAGHLFSLFFSIGALITGTTSLFIHNHYILVGVFLVVSLTITFTIKPFLEKFFESRKLGKSTNMDLIIGSIGIVTKRINNDEKGYVKVGNEEWLAASKDNEPLEEGTKIQVLSINGTTLIVSLFHEEVSVIN
jgi:membrane protein implicated in regulation of membrane protease activity